jgi:TolA-binding protein
MQQSGSRLRIALVSLALFLLASGSLAFAAERNVIELQVGVRDISDQALILGQSMDEDVDTLAQSLQQTSRQLAATQKKLTKLQQALKAASENPSSAFLIRKMAVLAQSTGELGARIEQIEHQVQALSTEIGGPPQPVVAIGQAPPPNALFLSGLEDYEAGRYQLASQEFAEYVRFYSATNRTAQAQFYLADSEYWAGDYQNAVRDFDELGQQYPATEAATVELKKGFCLMKLAQPDAARDDFRHIIEQYPDSVEAMEARSALRQMAIEAEVG